MKRAIVMLLALGFAIPAMAQVRQAVPQAVPSDVATEVDMMRQQLARAHAARDQTERDMAAAFIRMQNDNEAQKATLIEWLQTAQAAAAPK